MPNLNLFYSTPLFGNVGVGQTAKATISLAGTLSSSITIFSAILTGDPEFTIFQAVTPNPTLINPPPWSTLVLQFAPLAGTSYSATLTITHNGANSPSIVHVTGTGSGNPFLTLTPQTTNDFGMVKDGTTSGVLNVLAENNSNTDITVTAIAFSGTVGPITGSSIDIAGTGYALGDTGVIDGDSGDATYLVTGVSGAGAVLSYSLSNPGTGYTVRAGATTTSTTGTGTGLTISISTILTGEFAAGPGQPGLPFTLHANGVDPAVVIPVIFQPTVTGFVVDASAVVVTSGAGNSPTAQSMQGTGVIIFPAFSINISPQAVLFAFVLAGVVTVLKMDSTNLDCEEPASFTRIYDWTAPLQEKYLGRVIFRYQDESTTPFDLTCTANLTRVPLSVSDALINVGGANDGLIHNAFFDLQTSDDLIQIVINRAANDGPVIITEMFHEIDPRGEFVPT